VLYDLNATGDPLPWKITVHFSFFPEDEVLSCKVEQLEKVIESYYISMIKEVREEAVLRKRIS
jgi:hypothetical protein